MAGIICLDKPEGITSSKALAIVRRLAGTKKAGHTGTLDPMATGVLPIFLGRSTRLIGALPPRAKEYRAQVCLGLTTDTLDITGTVLERREAHVTREQLGRALDAFVGITLQTPPMYSAVSVNGIRLYELARQGIEVERKRRRITVYSGARRGRISAPLPTIWGGCSAVAPASKRCGVHTAPAFHWRTA